MTTIRKMVARLEHAGECAGDFDDCPLAYPGATAEDWIDSATGADFDEYHDADAARRAIEEDALSVQVRGGWHTPGGESEDEEFEILLTTGGPALRIVGDLDQWGQPVSPRMEMQDWFTPWAEVATTEEDNAALLTYCACFYFGG